MQNKRIIPIPKDQLDYIEGLSFLCEGYKQLIRHLSCQFNINKEILKEYSEKYEKTYTEYKMAFNELCKEHATKDLEDGYCLFLNIYLGALESRNCVVEEGNNSDKN